LSQLELSDRQRLTVATAVTILSACVILAAGGAILYLVALFLRTFSGVFVPLIVAAFLALVIRPYYDWFIRRLRFPRPIAVGAVLSSFLAPLVAFGWFFGALLFDQLVDLVDKLPEWWEPVRLWVNEKMPQAIELWDRYGLSESFRTAIDKSDEGLVWGLQFFAEKALSAGAGVLRGFGALFGWAVLPVYFAFFLMATPSLRSADEMLPFLKEETRSDIVYLAEQFIEIMVAFFRGQLIVALLQGLLFALGFSISGLRYGLVLGLLLGFLNIVPYLGSIVGLSICLPLALFQAGGGLDRVLWVIVVFTVVQLIEAYLLTPRIMGERTGLHPMVIIVAIFFWGSALGGISGMILAIPLTAFGVVFWRLAREKYISELV